MPTPPSSSRPKIDTFAAQPAPWPEDLQPALQAAAHGGHRRLVVLDDDPTGTQTVYDIPVVTDWSESTLTAELEGTAPGFYVLTNSRSLAPSATAALHRQLANNLKAASARTGVGVSLVSRSDSTLRGHYPLETDTLDTTLGPYDGCVLMPYFEAGGRFTLDSTHYVAEGDTLVPAANTPFARDATFGYSHSYLPDWIEEKTAGRVPGSRVLRITLDLIRRRGPDAVLTQLLELKHGQVAVCDALAPRDAEVVALASLRAEAKGRRLLYRTAASFAAARLGLAPRPLLTAADFDLGNSDAGGLIVVGSYVPKTTVQVDALLRDHPDHHLLTLSVPGVLDADRRFFTVTSLIEQVNAHLGAGESVVVCTSRDVVTGKNASESLAIVNVVSDALMAVIASLDVRPRSLIAKGGITSSDIATRALGVRRAIVRGQLLPGVPVWRLGEESRFPGLDYVIFPGNVGGDDALSAAATRLQPAPP